MSTIKTTNKETLSVTPANALCNDAMDAYQNDTIPKIVKPEYKKPEIQYEVQIEHKRQ